MVTKLQPARAICAAGALSSFIGIFASATLSLADEPEVPTPKSKSSDSGEDAQVRLGCAWCQGQA